MADLVASELTQRAMSGESSVLNVTRFTIIATCVVGARGEILTGHVGGACMVYPAVCVRGSTTGVRGCDCEYRDAELRCVQACW